MLSSNKAGYSNIASADITPSQPVYSKHLLISWKLLIPPLDTTGILTVFLIRLIISQLQLPTLCLFCYLVRPCTVNITIPKFSNFFTKFIVLSSSSKILILQLKGKSKFFTTYSTISNTLSSYSNKKDP